MLGVAAIFLSVLGLTREVSCAVASGENQYIVEYANGIVPRDLPTDGPVKVVKTLDSPGIFTGAVIEATSKEEASTFASNNRVANMWPNQRIELDEPLDRRSFADDVAATEYSVHAATGVDRLHAEGILGQGVKVAVVDSGVWYKHPALGGGFGPGFKVAGGWDLVGDTGRDDPPQPDDDPLDSPSIGHGTHVAGIVAGSSDRFVGVAPNATILAYKVMGTIAGSTTATIMDAWLRAYSDGADVITMSISGLTGWSENPLAVLAARLVGQGVVMTVSAGNNGADGPFFAGDANTSPHLLSIASVEASVDAASPYRLTVTTSDGVSNTTRSGYLPAAAEFPAEVDGWPIVALNLNTSNTDDACSPYPAGTANLTGAVALVRRTAGCSFVLKQRNLQALGAKYVLVYNDNRPIVTPGSSDPGSLLGMITAEAGHAIIDAIVAGANVTADFSRHSGDGPLVGIPDLQAGGKPSVFSSWSSTYDLQLKPDVAAPGGNIFSTWPEDSYMVQSGTSMATPYVAGIAALYISAFGGRGKHGPGFAAELTKRIASAGSTLPWYDGTTTSSEFVAPPLQMGSGLVNATRVLRGATTLDATKLNLNDTANFQGAHDVTVTNGGAAPVSYSFALEPAAGLEIVEFFNVIVNSWGIRQFSKLEPKQMVPDVQLPEPFSLGPGESKTVTVTFANPEGKGWNDTLLPAYSGKVIVSGDNGDQLSLPYMGIASSLYKNARVFRNTYPLSFSGESTWYSIDEKPYYNFNLTKGGRDFPWIHTSFTWGVKEFRWDIFHSNWSESEWTYPPTPGANGFVDAVSHYTGPSLSDEGVFGAPPYNLSDPFYSSQMEPFPQRFISRHSTYNPGEQKYWWMGKMANGSQIAPGNYTMRVAASKPLADLTKVDGWEVWRREIQVLPLI
ncbi:hypothetical protein PpBr36_04001 [Pyricularia pennisetigena]|uniref:hypothetical protein n=1 Tax=Pyricularia pennisetigena TaxID=1578925 RepID=UPI0011512BCD|nr:hypothetical protein PpBr36_04001 [Pyricularia pennisetigena]TLS27276.1 hypothetical protein PpBr36_04001 [Pyricularia pennisetigena]